MKRLLLAALAALVAAMLLPGHAPFAQTSEADRREQAYRQNNLGIAHLEQYDYAGATAIATVMLGASFILLLIINLLQRWGSRRYAPR
jgi:outer membrane biogenesis lipoprotein LolB